jgi:hypothetical protein
LSIEAVSTGHEGVGLGQLGQVRQVGQGGAEEARGPGLEPGRAVARLGDAAQEVGWHIGQERRKHIMGTALFDQTGQRLGMARATWIEMRTEPG